MAPGPHSSCAWSGGGNTCSSGLDGGVTLLMHLGMTGRLLLGVPADHGPHIHLFFTLEDGVTLAFQDVRRFGQVLVFPPGQPLAPLDQVGREPFSRQVTPEWLAKQPGDAAAPSKIFSWTAASWPASATSTPVKSCSPPAAPRHPGLGALSRGLADGAKETRRILKRAIRQGGTTVSNYLNSQGEAGLFQVELLVYGKTGEPCRRCGAPIARLVQAGRSSFFCPALPAEN